jgi:hypothetical protein
MGANVTVGADVRLMMGVSDTAQGCFKLSVSSGCPPV